jgi:hypothetical protein
MFHYEMDLFAEISNGVVEFLPTTDDDQPKATLAWLALIQSLSIINIFLISMK